jgi:hypothetical protein
MEKTFILSRFRDRIKFSSNRRIIIRRTKVAAPKKIVFFADGF